MNSALCMEDFLTYKGPIDFTIRRNLVAELRQKLNNRCQEILLRKRASYIFEELITNAHEYYKKKAITGCDISVTIKLRNDSELVFHISNSLLQEDTDAFLQRVEQVNKSGKEELQVLLQQGLAGESEGVFGAGLGLITIRLKTGVSFKAILHPAHSNKTVVELLTTIQFQYE
jgi:hypothetical protein